MEATVTGKAEERESVVDPRAPKQEQEKRVEDEIEKSDAELFGDKPAPAHGGGAAR
jgi:hypothetical protein